MLSEEIILGQPSWVLVSDEVYAAVTEAGAHLAPVTFFRNQVSKVLPYHISPWQGQVNGLLEGSSDAVLRGDFFCLPFGKPEPSDGMYAHGKTAGARWSFMDSESKEGLHSLRIFMENALHLATVTRQFLLCDGENVIYDSTSISGLDGAFPLGHHAVLRTPEQSQALLVSTSTQVFGMTFPAPFAAVEKGERQSLAIAAEFDSPKSVPSIDGNSGSIDCSAFPFRRGFGDLLQVAVEARCGQPAWTAAVNTQEGYLWFSLRDPALLPSTIFWIENCNRHSFPWNGRNCSLGLEDVCSYFDFGVSASRAPNVFSRRGIKTVQKFDRDQTFQLQYIQGAIRVPQGFRHVQDVRCDDGSATFVDVNGITATAAVQAGFVFGDHLKRRSKSIGLVPIVTR